MMINIVTSIALRALRLVETEL